MANQENDLRAFLPSKPFLTEDGETIEVTALSMLSPELRQRFVESSRRSPRALSSLEVFSADETIGLLLSTNHGDQVAFVNPATNKAELILVDDSISYEPLSPMQLVEYRFDGGIQSPSILFD